ncbi:hypothetical protein ACKAMS_32595 [Rhodococcus sp. 5A-K4]|uniref:hypothetical protein n=1 Tax=Rhodococcus TaxID=1827 RepID=UPI00355BE322
MSDIPVNDDAEDPPAKKEKPKPENDKMPAPDNSWLKTEGIHKKYDGDEEERLEK